MKKMFIYIQKTFNLDIMVIKYQVCCHVLQLTLYDNNFGLMF